MCLYFVRKVTKQKFENGNFVSVFWKESYLAKCHNNLEMFLH